MHACVCMSLFVCRLYVYTSECEVQHLAEQNEASEEANAQLKGVPLFHPYAFVCLF